MSISDYELTITVKVSTTDPQGINCLEFEALLQDMLSDYSNGRHHFNTELIQDGLQRELDAVVLELLKSKMIDKYGHQRITDGRGRSTSCWYHEAKKKFMDAIKPHLCWEPTVRIEPCETSVS